MASSAVTPEGPQSERTSLLATHKIHNLNIIHQLWFHAKAELSETLRAQGALSGGDLVADLLGLLLVPRYTKLQPDLLADAKLIGFSAGHDPLFVVLLARSHGHLQVPS